MLALPSLFAPRISYVRLLLRHPDAVIYVGEQYTKQTLRNRTYLLTPQGVTAFTIPVAKIGYPSPPTSEVFVAEHDRWRHRLEEALRSTYRSTPFWQFYEEEVMRLCRFGQGGRLVDLNWEWLHFILSEWRIPDPVMTENGEGLDFHSEVAQSGETSPRYPRYWQVFEETTGFVSNLSALDLLFHLGPEGRLYLLSLGY